MRRTALISLMVLLTPISSLAENHSKPIAIYKPTEWCPGTNSAPDITLRDWARNSKGIFTGEIIQILAHETAGKLKLHRAYNKRWVKAKVSRWYKKPEADGVDGDEILFSVGFDELPREGGENPFPLKVGEAYLFFGWLDSTAQPKKNYLITVSQCSILPLSFAISEVWGLNEIFFEGK